MSFETLSLILSCLISISISTMFISIHANQKKIIELLSSSLNSSNTSEATDLRKDELTTYELERLEREEEFDKRINRLKEEVSLQQNIIRKGVSAEELHPLVHNLPHNIIRNKEDYLPDVEVSE